MPTTFAPLAANRPLATHLLFLSQKDFFILIVADTLMAFNSLTCTYLYFDFDGQNSPNFSSYFQVVQRFKLWIYFKTLWVPKSCLLLCSNISNVTILAQFWCPDPSGNFNKSLDFFPGSWYLSENFHEPWSLSRKERRIPPPSEEEGVTTHEGVCIKYQYSDQIIEQNIYHYTFMFFKILEVEFINFSFIVYLASSCYCYKNSHHSTAITISIKSILRFQWVIRAFQVEKSVSYIYIYIIMIILFIIFTW